MREATPKELARQGAGLLASGAGLVWAGLWALPDPAPPDPFCKLVETTCTLVAVSIILAGAAALAFGVRFLVEARRMRRGQ